MKDFFKSVRKHIGKLDAVHLREQYSRISDELAFSEMIFNTTSDGYVVLDASGQAMWSNPAAERLFGMKIADIIPTLSLPLGRASRRDISVTYPEQRFLQLQTIPMNGETLVKISDVTLERRRSEEELRAGASEAVRQLASGVAHEIGNPLNAIALNLQILSREHPGDESVSDCIQQIARLDGILRGFLQALKPSRPNLTPGSIVIPIKNTLSTLENQFIERNIRVNFNAPSGLPVTAVDESQLEQVFFNLLKNSIEAMKSGGEITLDIGYDDDAVTVGITDTGVGMDNETITHLFEAYRSTREHGNGLGLMISQRIIIDHGGTIDVESEVGHGSKFTIRIPRIEKRIRRLK
ncbi:MAG: hypothetical protein J6S51_06215 [Kiritimatiellae bacterium]|nr:hypothetical protein [Kiritimatiellia bacterium]